MGLGVLPVHLTKAHKYHNSKLNWTIMHELFIVALNCDDNIVLWHT